MPIIADDLAADSLAAQQDAIGGPLETAMRSDILPIAAGGRVRIDAGYWEPMVQVAPKIDLGNQRLIVEARQTSPVRQLDPAIFERLSERGTWITLLVPTNLAGRRTAAAIRLELVVRLDGAVQTLARTRELIDVRVVEGTFARIVHLLSAEQPRLRRQARLLHDAATLEGARGFMLDLYGQELAVPRLTDRLVVRSGQIVTDALRESDPDYRRRLALYRRWFGASRSAVLGLINGSSGTPGALQAIGGPASFTINERDNPLFSAVRIISVGATAAAATTQRNNFLAYVRATTLIDPAINVPNGRSMPVAARQQQNALRARLQVGLTFADATSRAMAPFLANAFDRLVGVLRGFGVTTPVNIIRAQQNDGGVRYELGLGAEIDRLPAAALNSIRAGITGTLPTGLGVAELTVVADLRAAGSLADPNGAWLLRACGFATVEPTSATRQFVSHLPIGQLDIAGPNDLVFSPTLRTSGVAYAAVMNGNSDGLGMALAHALGGGADGWPTGDPPWTIVAQAQLPATLDALVALDTATAGVVASSGIRVLAAADIARFATATKRYPAGSVAVLTLDPAFATALAGGTAAALARWSRIVETLGSNGAASAALFAGTGTARILVVSAHGLPLIGSNIGARRSTGFYWNCMLVSDGASGGCSGSGTETMFRPTAPGVYALHCLGSARIGETDPYEYAVDLPAGTTINLAQYEMLMNMLARCYPVGIEVNTWSLRRSHIDLGAGTPTPLTPRQSRSFRRWQRPHFAGVDLNRPDFTPL